MAAATVNNSLYGYSGNRRILWANISLANTNTLATGFGQIDAFQITTSTTQTLGGTVSGGTITFTASGADAAAQLVVYGV